MVRSLGKDQHEQILVMLGAKDKELASLVDRISRTGGNATSDPGSPLSGFDLRSPLATNACPRPPARTPFCV